MQYIGTQIFMNIFASTDNVGLIGNLIRRSGNILCHSRCIVIEGIQKYMIKNDVGHLESPIFGARHHEFRTDIISDIGFSKTCTSNKISYQHIPTYFIFVERYRCHAHQCCICAIKVIILSKVRQKIS